MGCTAIDLGRQGHRDATMMTFTGPEDQLVSLRKAAAGSAIVPWLIDYDQREEDCFHWLAAPKNGRRGVSVAAAHTMAKQLREAEWQMHETASARWSLSRVVPFDLHALAPVPGEVLRLGPDDPASLRWMWRNWGTTWTLRRVEEAESRAWTWSVRFFSADWSPWPVLALINQRWRVNARVAVTYFGGR
jgi:hypothetical protein